MEQNYKEYCVKNERERKSLYSESNSVKDQNLVLSESPKTPTALKDLNALTKEKSYALKSAQRKWMEDMSQWSTSDDIQKAQLEWIQKYSACPNFSAIKSPEKKKDTPWTLPFSPPRSSSEISQRRGYCVYEPGHKDNVNRKVKENISEHISDVKIAQLLEPAKVNLGSYVSPSSTFSPFAESKSSKCDRSPQKRHITVRKKLQCQKKLTELNEAAKVQPINEASPNSKSGNAPDKSEEERRAARKYIHRKRVERERQLREQKQLEEKAEQEQRARMERLKETQHRILANSVKKPPKQRQKKESWVGLEEKAQEDKPLSREMLEPPDYSGAHITGAIPFLSSRRKKISSPKDSKSSSPRAPSTAETRWTQDENVPPLSEDICDGVPLDIIGVEGAQFLLSTRLSSPTKHSSSSGRPSSSSSVPEKLEEFSLQKPSTPALSVSPVHCKSSSREHSVAEVTPLASEVELFTARSSLVQSHPPVIHGSTQNQFVSSVDQRLKKESWVGLEEKAQEDKPLSREMLEPPDYSGAHITGEIPFLSSRRKQISSPKDSKSSPRAPSTAEIRWTQDENVPPLSEDICDGVPLDIIGVEGAQFLLSTRLSSPTKLKRNDLASGSEKPTTLHNSNYPLFMTSNNLFSDSQYNMLTAISNKRLAYKELENESVRKQQKTYPSFDMRQPPVSNNNFGYDKTAVEEKNFDEKGIQCQVDFDDRRYTSSTSDQLGSISSYSDVKLTQSEQLQKPNVILLPGRLSDPHLYSRTKESNNDVRIDTTVSENLSIDPLNISGRLSLVARQSVDSSNDVIRDRPGPEASPKIDNCDFCSTEPEEKFRSLDMKINSKSHRKISQDFNLDDRLPEATNSEKDSAGISQVKNTHVAKKVEAEVKKLDIFEDCIRAALEKYKGGRSDQSGEVSKLSFNDHLDITLKNYNLSDVSLAASRDTSMAKTSHLYDVGHIERLLNVFIDLLKEENLRNGQQESYFKMRETSIVEKTKAEIAYLELEKKRYKLMGSEDGVRNVRKKIRGLIMKLQQNLEDLQLVKKMEKAAYRGRRKLLLEKIDQMKDQLKNQMESERKVKKDLRMDTSRSSIDSSKEAPIFLETLERRKTVPVVTENPKRIGDNEEKKLSWKQKLEEGERRIQELEELIKRSPLGKDMKIGMTVERGTSPLQLSSDEDRKKGDGSYSDTIDQLSTSSQHEKLENKDARKMIALKVPLSPRIILKRRHSSGSDESLLLSQPETQSDASDMETRVLALQQQLKQRKAELQSLHREYKKSQRERLIAKEQSLLSQIHAYDMYIGQVKKELDKERDGTVVKIVKPVIKHPKLSCERRKSDTWLLQEKKLLSNSSRQISSNSCELVKNKQQGTKNQMDDKFLDNKALEKFTLKTDLSQEVGELQYDEQFIRKGVLADEMIGCGEAENDRKTSSESVHHVYDHTSLLESTSPVKSDIISSINLDEEKSFVEGKIDFYEKLSDNSYSSVDINAETLSSQSQNKKASTVKEISFRQDVKSSEQILAPITSDSSGTEHASSSSMSESKHSSVTVENSQLTNENKNLSYYDSIKEEKGIDPLQKTELIKIDTDISINRGSDNISQENSEVKDDLISIIVTEIEENLSNDNIQEITSVKDISSTHSYIKEMDQIIPEDDGIKEEYTIIEEYTDKEEDSIKEEGSIKEVSELLSEVPGSVKSKEESLNEEISEFISISKVKDLVPVEEILNEPLDNKSELSEVEEVENSIQISHSKKDNSIEDVVSSINSELSSSASFPLPTFKNKTVEASQLKENSMSDQSSNDIANDQPISGQQHIESEIEIAVSEATLQEKQPSSVVDEISLVQDISNDRQIIESEVESTLSESASAYKEPSSVVEEVESANSQTEEIRTELSKDQEIRSEVEESLKQLITEQINSISSEYKISQARQSVSEEVEEALDLDRSITESLVDASLAEDQEDSLDEDINRVILKSKLIEHDDGCESGNSFIDDKEMYNIINKEKREGRGAGAPLIDALQREGDSVIDQVWRGIADTAVNDATDLVISTFFNKAAGVHPIRKDKLVGDSDDEEWDGEELHRQQAAEAEVLRLQQLRIDKEIEELEEEEARRYYYIRPIPDKPPPPYTPRRSSLVASVVEAAGEIWDGRTEAPSTFMAGCHLREFLWDLAAELVVRVRPSSPPPQPSWVHIRRRRPKRHIRTKEDLLEEVEKEAKIYLGVEERECRENLIIRWSRKRRDHVDEILVKESQEEEWEWTDYSEEENIIKNRIADAIIQESLTTATAAIAQAFIRKFKE